MSKIRVLLVDDHRIVRDGVAALLSAASDIEIVGKLSSGEEAVSFCQEYKPDIVTMDIMMTGMTGLEATRWIKEQTNTIKVIIVSSEIKKDLVSLGIKCGIDGYLPKDVDGETLINAIRAVHKGEKYFNATITTLIFEDYYFGQKDDKKRERKKVEGLTKRESEVIEAVALGKTNSEIAEALFISVKTVETHKMNILEKLGLRNTAELVRYAIKNNIISID